MIMKQVQASVREEIRPEKIPSSGHLASATKKGFESLPPQGTDSGSCAYVSPLT